MNYSRPRRYAIKHTIKFIGNEANRNGMKEKAKKGTKGGM